ncbi:L-type lectin-domain containing receptor kinase S.4-like [Durio zibethinus]|uniref:non-specific serine/threonine protein kinase n=1 Tax=Durio zibethinus TaxID=66656 RepID=A0A6P5Z7T3_DURZI|nr:L-type lectin-domain containing receptor kinase S.4-like [Durio zibethinus]
MTPAWSFLTVEFDIVQNLELHDISDNHVGKDISSLISNVSEPAAHYSANASDINDNRNNSIVLKSGETIQAWIDYDGKEMLMNVSISPRGMLRPHRPLISFPIDLSLVLDEYMYVGFSDSTGLLKALHYVQGWSFTIGPRAQDLDPRKLPFLKTRIREGDEILEDWEIEYGAWRFMYSELFSAARGFGEKNLIGSGGFGRLYSWVIPSTGLEVAMKMVSNGSRQGMKEFVAEITSMGRLRPRNLVHLHGWCRKQDELLLTYDYFPNGSLDKLLYDDSPLKGKKLTWDQRYKILTGGAHASPYLHEECNQIHRDVKPSNVLIDEDLNAKLGDFGLARTYEMISIKRQHIVGTLGYLAPELTRTGKATTSTDVYSYGTLKLEVAGRRRPIETQKNAKELLPTMRRVVQLLQGDATIPPLPHDIHVEVPMAITEDSDSFADDSDPSCHKMTSTQSNSSTSFDKKLSTGHTTRVTFQTISQQRNHDCKNRLCSS